MKAWGVKVTPREHKAHWMKAEEAGYCGNPGILFLKQKQHAEAWADLLWRDGEISTEAFLVELPDP